MQSHDGPRNRAIASLCEVFHGLSGWCRSLFLVCGCAPDWRAMFVRMMPA